MSFTSLVHFTQHFSYWLVLWFLLFVVEQAVRRWNQVRHHVSNHSSSPPLVPNPFYLFVGAAIVNALWVAYTLGLYAAGTTFGPPRSLFLAPTLAMFLAIACVIKIAPILLLRGIPQWRTYNAPGAIRRTGVAFSVTFAAYVGWLLWCWKAGSVPFADPSTSRRLRYGLAAGYGPMMRIFMS